MLLQQIKEDQLAARKVKDSTRASLLTTLYSEASIIGKNAGRDTTDEEVTKVIQKFLKGNTETINALSPSDQRHAQALQEKTILEGYLPKMASEEQILDVIRKEIAGQNTKIGIIMKVLKETFGTSLDGQLASSLIKQELQ